MYSLAKIFVFISMLCYLATSSIAAVHAFPMITSSGSDQSTSLDVNSSTSTAQVASLKMSQSLMPCHQLSGSSADNVKASNACKNFCSSMGHALASVDEIHVAAKPQHPAPYTRTKRLLTRQSSVDQQPPK